MQRLADLPKPALENSLLREESGRGGKSGGVPPILLSITNEEVTTGGRGEITGIYIVAELVKFHA